MSESIVYCVIAAVVSFNVWLSAVRFRGAWWAYAIDASLLVFLLTVAHLAGGAS